MNRIKLFFLVVLGGIFFALPAWAAPADNNSSLLSGRILSDAAAKNFGDLWYVYPGDFHRYYIGDSNYARQTVVNLALGISNDDFEKIYQVLRSESEINGPLTLLEFTTNDYDDHTLDVLTRSFNRLFSPAPAG